jgi:hypothetical protein
VKVVVAHGDKNFEFPLMPPPPGSNSRTYTYLFDTSKLPINALFPSITFRASDVLGNESSVGYLVSLDNMPPLADLDPPDDFRVFFRPSGGSGLRCSWPFDPVGPEAVDDGGRATQLFDIRARIEDQGNDPRSGTADFTPISTVDKAELLIMDDTSRPLIVDSRRRADGPTPEGRRDEPDGYCDEVNPNLTISASAAASPDVLLITMAPMSPGGDVDGTVDPNATCDSGGGRAPEVKCATTYNAAKTRWDTTATPAIGHVDHMSSVISYANAGLPAIWTVPPVIEDKVQCAGRQFDALANNLKDGWACVAVRATDKLGNQQISRVLRLCIDHDGKGNECPHRSVASVSATSPMVVETRTPHGFKAGDAVLVSEVFPQTSANGRWTVQVVDATRFALVGSAGHAGLGPATTGLVVGAAELPDCTGTVTAVGPPATVDGSKACKPWRSYARGETRVQAK